MLTYLSGKVDAEDHDGMIKYDSLSFLLLFDYSFGFYVQ